MQGIATEIIKKDAYQKNRIKFKTKETPGSGHFNENFRKHNLQNVTIKQFK